MDGFNPILAQDYGKPPYLHVLQIHDEVIDYQITGK